MPKLKQVLPAGRREELRGLLDVEVVAVRLNTGAPCLSHAGPFEAWPGEGDNVRQWFVLENGKAVAIDERPDGPPVFPVVDYRDAV
ncbi:MAG: hypothetical protein VW338_02430 [Rhodospirillaceae bacterium]